MDGTGDLRRFDLGDLPVAGGVLPGAVLTYRLWGRLEPGCRDLVLLPSFFTGTSAAQAGWIEAGRALDPAERPILAVDLFGNGVATSPSHWPDNLRGTFPAVSIADNVRAQKALLDALGVAEIALVQGWSVAAIQSWFWAAMYPEMTRAILPVCGTARCWPLNRVFLESLDPLLDPAPDPSPGLRRFGRVYAGWVFSPEYWREEMWRECGHETLEDVLRWWEEDHLPWHPADLRTCLRSWRDADIGDLHPDGWEASLAAITARAIVMPASSDRYFTVEEAALEAAAAGAELRVIETPYGHSAGAPARHKREADEIEAAMRDLLA